ncbi:kelch-like protein 7 [Arctopsyche grandis]|uniref:kelch-like protein 7 n=1 Tax=Arctopsyche grandis TaxID=121162 RepID=UPI00406D8924
MRRVLDGWKGGITIGSRKISSISSTDDTTLMTSNEDEMTELLRRIEIESRHLGLEINKNPIRVKIFLSIVIKPQNDSAPNHSLLFGLIGEIRNKMFIVKAKSDFAAKRVEYLYDAMEQNKKCDIGFTVRDRSFPAHLICLMACSKFFGTIEVRVEEIFSDFDFEVIEAILKYCYTGEISIDENHFEKLMELANRLEVKIPKQFKTADLSNCLEVLKSTADSELIKMAMDLTLENFETLHNTQDFLYLPVSNVIKILKSDDLVVASEERVFNGVKLWVNHDYENRKTELAQLMRSVRLSLLSMEFLADDVMTFCLSCAECMTSVRQEIIYKNNRSFIQRETLRRKKGKIALVGGWNISTANTIDTFDVLNKSWTLSKDIGINKTHFASVVMGDWMVIIGGLNSLKQSVTSVEYIDLKNGQKHPLKPLNEVRWLFPAVTLRCDSSTDIYAIGGSDNDILYSVERWNSKTGDWQIIAPLLLAVYHHSASVVNDKIYVTGGLTRQNAKQMSSNKVQMYSVETNSWTYRAQMIQGREDHSSVEFKGLLFVAGGYIRQTSIYLDSVEHYDPIANLWTAFTRLPKPAFGISLCCYKHKLLSIGGYDGKNDLSDVWEYDKTCTTWKASKSLSRERAIFTAHVIPYNSII